MRLGIAGQNKNHILDRLFLLFILIVGSGWTQAIKEEALALKYREWLDLTRYICLPQEREVFFKLSSDRERDLFIEAFWRQRDPTPGTPQNEYRDDISSRFVYANRQFGRGTTKPGWLTDMGKIHILLGPPASRERYEELRGMYPCEAWYYYGDPARGLPTYFGFLFFTKRGIGDYVLYNQVQDGPAALLVDGHNYDATAYAFLYQKIKEIAPALAPLAISMVPSESSPDFQPSLRTDAILADILNSPRQEVGPSYATHFLNYRGIVSTEYLTNYVEIEGLVEVMPDPALGIDFVHFSLTPKSVSVDYYRPKDQYFCNYSVDVSLRDGEKIICQYAKEFPFYYAPSDDPVVRANGISLQDSFPVSEGKYNLTILVRNSVGKEFSVFEKEIEVEKAASPRIGGWLVGCGHENAAPGQHAPFQVLDEKISLAVRQTFVASDEITLLLCLSGLTERIWNKGEVRVDVRPLEGVGPAAKTFLLKLDRHPFQPIMAISHSFPASELKPDYYEITLSLVDDTGAIVDTSKTQIILSPAEVIPRPVVISKSFPLSNAYLYSYMLADQYDRAGRPESAEALFEKGYTQAPDYQEGILCYADFLVRQAQFERALALSENFAGGEKFRLERLLIKGKALMGMGRYEEAIESLVEGNMIYNSDTNLLNALGVCYLRTGRKDRAREALAASLRLNPDQPKISKLIEDIQK
ncbi:MAG: GWxTD domain-containing protein [Candidatus Aminicenantales bacterium]